MAISSSQANRGDVHDQIETVSVYNCIFCNILLNGQALMLECLHVACRKCVGEKMDNSGLMCECLTVSNCVNVNYPIVSSSISKKCDTCDSVPNNYCLYCKKLFCIQCLKVHLTSDEGRTHDLQFIVSYPMENQKVMCLKCSEKNAEVYCSQCSVIICCLCHLSFHRNHNYTVLEKLYEKIKANLSEEMLKLNKNDEYIEHVVNNIKKENQKLIIQMNSIFNEIDIVKQKLHDEINKRSIELKELFGHSFRNHFDEINKNQEILQDTKKNNKYYMKLIQTILENDKFDEIVSLSKTILKKLGEPNQAISISDKVSELKVDVKFSSDGSVEKCISAIQNVGRIIKTSISDSEDLKNSQISNSNDNLIIDEDFDNLEDILGSSTDLDEESVSSDYEPFVECSCCNQWAEKLIQCNNCNRNFHHDCHIPNLNKDMYDSNPLQTMWKCTMCQDITRYAKVLHQKDMNGEIPVGKTELVIMERILMEIYCQNNDSEHYRELPNKELYPVYYEKVANPLSLNNVKNTLESNESYKFLITFLKDLKQVFSIGQLYYSPSDPYYRSAVNLQLLLERLINRWIPDLRDDNRLR